MSSATRANSFSRKAFKNALVAHKSDGELLSRTPPPPPPPDKKAEQPAQAHEPSAAKSAAAKRMSRALSTRKHSMIAADNLASDKQHGDTASAGHSPYNAPMTLQRGDHLESAHKSALAGSGRDRSVSKSRNVSFMYDGEDPDGGVFRPPQSAKKDPPATGTAHAGAAPEAHSQHKNKNISVALKARRYSTNLVNPNENPLETHKPGSPTVFRSGEFQSFDFSLAPERSPSPESQRRVMGRSGSISIAEPNIFNQSSFVSRLFGYVEGEEIKRKLRASKSGIALTPELKITPTASKDTDDELLTMQSTIMNSDLYRLIIAENEKRMNNPSSPAMPEIDYTEMENIKDGISLAASAANDDDDEEDYMRLIANLNLDVTAPSEKEVWEVKYNNVGFNVMVGAAAQNDGIKAAAKLIKKAKQAVAEQELRAREPVPAASIEAPMNPPKRKKKKHRDGVEDGKRRKKREGSPSRKPRVPEMRRMSTVTDSLIKNMVPLRIGMHQEDDMPPPPPPDNPVHENDDVNFNAAQHSKGGYMLSRAYSAGFRKASLAETKFHSADMHAVEQKLQHMSDSDSDYDSVTSEDSTEVSLTLSAKCRKAQLDHVHKMKKEIWGRAAVGIESNFSNNPKILQMKEVAFEKGIRLLEAEFGEYRDKDRKWEGLQTRRPTLKLR